VYRRGVLVRVGKPQRKRRVQKATMNAPAIEFDDLPWESVQTGKTRVEAINRLWQFYRDHPRKYQRRDPSELYEVTRAVHEGYGSWVLTVRWQNGVRR